MMLSLYAWLIAVCLPIACAYPSWSYRSVVGLSDAQLRGILPRDSIVGSQPPPGPLSNDSAKLVHDDAHPYRAPGPNDVRGPCPGLNTLANHGYLNRSGIVTPQEIVTAVQEGFNMGNDVAILITWGAHLVDGNLLTNLMSLGPSSPATGAPPPAPATAAGLNQHGVFEGDASTTRGDAYFGDNHSFNLTQWEELVSLSNKYGKGQYNARSAAEVRYQRFQDSKKTNPQFVFNTPRIFTAYGESVFPFRFFVDGRSNNGSLDLTAGRGFFDTNTFPPGFFRRKGAFLLADLGKDISTMAAKHWIRPGVNQGANNYVYDRQDKGLNGGVCAIYTKHASITVPSLYPNPTGDLLAALKGNLQTFYSAVASNRCNQVFPYGM